MADLTFYTNPMSRGQIARWMLEEVGEPYDTELLGYDNGMKSDDYLAINPMGKVPAIRHGDKVVTEAAAICAYLAETFPDAGLAPTDGERADYYRWTFFCAGPLEQAITDRHLGLTPTDEQQRMVGYGSYDKAVDALDGALQGRDFICGDRFTGADVYVGSSVDWGLAFGTLPERDTFKAYAERFRAREAYKRAKQIDNDLIAEQEDASS